MSTKKTKRGRKAPEVIGPSLSTGQHGFTLAELIVVVIVIALLASAVLPMTKVTVKRAKELELHRALRQMRRAIDLYKQMADEGKIQVEATSGGYPENLEVLVRGVRLVDTPGGQSGSANVNVNIQIRTRDEDGNMRDVSRTGGINTGKPRIFKFLRRLPVDPMTGERDWKTRSSTDEPDDDYTNGEDVFDVYSASDKTALDGTKYRDW